MEEDALRQARILLQQASDLRDQVQANLEVNQFSDDDILMQRYNALAGRAASLFPDDPEIGERRLFRMPDANLQSVSLFPGLISSRTVSTRLKARLEVVIARLQSLLGEYSPEATPAVQGDSPAGRSADVERILAGVEGLRRTGPQLPRLEIRSFDFVSDLGIRRILSEDYLEAQRAYAVDAFKAAGLLAGGVIEGMLLDGLRQPQVAALEGYERATRRLPRGQGGDIRWNRVSLEQLTHAARQLGLLREQVVTLLAPVRGFRDTVHPWSELTHGERVRHGEAHILLGAVMLVYDDLDRGR